MKQKGFTLIELMIVIAIIAIIAAIAIPNLIEARKGANESSAIATMRTLVTCQTLYRESDKDGNGTADYSTSLIGMSQAGLIDEVLAGGEKQGYTFILLPSANSRYTWTSSAGPSDSNTGRRYFFVDESGVIRFSPFDYPADSLEATPIGN